MSRPRRPAGFIARFDRKPAAVADAEIPEPTFNLEYERVASARLVELLTHAELEELLGALGYTIRRARTRQTGLDRRGSKPELAAAFPTKHGIDLFADAEIRKLVPKRGKVDAPGRWHPGKSSALRFVQSVKARPAWRWIQSVTG